MSIRMTSLKLNLDTVYYPNKFTCSVDISSYTDALGLDIRPYSSNL